MTARTILFVCDFNGHGGTQTHLMNLFAAIDRDRFRPWLAAPNLHPALATRLSMTDVEVTDLQLAGALRLHTAGAVRSLAGQAARRGVDLIHGYLFSGNLIAASVSMLTGIGCVTSVRNVDIWKKRRHRVASALAHRRSRHVLFNSTAVRRQVMRLEWIDPARTSIIYNSVADPRDPSRTPAQPVLPPGAGRPLVVCVASLRNKKGHADLLAAFALVRQRLPEATLLLVGEGPERESLARRATQVCPPGAVLFMGYREDATAILACCDLFVMASLEEGMPNALLEAMAARLPAVVTDVGGNAEALIDGTTGYLVPAGNPVAMAGRIIEILSDPDRRLRFGSAARLRYESEFTLDRMTSAYHELYERLIGRAG